MPPAWASSHRRRPMPGTAVTLVPYFDGERTPNLPDATGSFHGLTNPTTRAQLALAAHDGVLSGLLGGLEALRSVGASIDGRIFLVGGGSRSAVPAATGRPARPTGHRPRHRRDRRDRSSGAGSRRGERRCDRSITERWHLGAGTTVEPRRPRSCGTRRYVTRSAQSRRRRQTSSQPIRNEPSRSSGTISVRRPSVTARSQIRLGSSTKSSVYSASKTRLPAARNGALSSHSSYS